MYRTLIALALSLTTAAAVAAEPVPATQNQASPEEALQQIGQLLLGNAAAPKGKADKEGKGEEARKVALFSLSGALTEKPAPIDDPFSMGATESLASLTKRMRAAAEDDEVKAVVLLYSGMSLGRAQSEELIDAVRTVKSSGKPVWSHADALMMGGYTLLAQADRVSVSPEGAVIVTGIHGGQMYLRGMLDKIGVEPDFVAIGDYKSAGEMFTRTGPSDFARDNLDWLFDSLYDSMLDQIAKGRGVDRTQAEAWVDEGVYSGVEAVDDGLIDAAETREQLVEALEKELGGKVAFDRKYGKAKSKTIDLSTPFGVLNFYAELLGGPRSTKITKPTVAIVHVNGPIMDGSPTPSPFGSAEAAYSQPIRRALLNAAEEEMVKAVVLRVDSPGGSAIASEVILQATKLVADEKPLIVSMGNVAGSGGYYVAMGGERIFADATTITGSIGVVSGKFATNEMWGKLGIDVAPFSRGKNADLFSSETPWSDAQKKELTEWMLDAYKTFTGHVKANRGDKLSLPIDELAGGRVFSGQQAIANGLVDEIGTLHDAVAYAAKQAKLNEGDYNLQAFPRPKSFMELLAADLQPKQDKHPNRLELSIVEAALPFIQKLDPVRAKAARDALRQLQIVHENRIGLVAPIILTGP